MSVLDFVLDEIKKVEFIPSLKDVKVKMKINILFDFTKLSSLLVTRHPLTSCPFLK